MTARATTDILGSTPGLQRFLYRVISRFAGDNFFPCDCLIQRKGEWVVDIHHHINNVCITTGQSRAASVAV